MRASDQDRDEAVISLGEHHAAGRLTVPEFTASTEQASACTYLDALIRWSRRDLPAIRSGLVLLTAAPARRPARRPERPPVAALAVPLPLIAFAVVMVAAGFFFPFWVPILLFWMMGGPRRHRRMQRTTSWAPHDHRNLQVIDLPDPPRFTGPSHPSDSPIRRCSAAR